MRLRIHKKHQAKFYYALSSDDAFRIRVVGGFGLASLVSLVVGFYFFSSQSYLIALLCAPLFAIIAVYHLINYALMLVYPGFSTKMHRLKVAEFQKIEQKPKVAVFIPAAGEDVDIVSQTVGGAVKIDYPNFDVFILDDSKKGIYKDLATRMNIVYFRRKNTGVNKKAGNMNAAMKNLKGYSHILVLDADFVPRREIIKELMSYATDDVGIVQSPQHFALTDEVYSRSKVEFGAGMIQRDFYRITQVARDRFGGAICVGTNAIYSVSALRRVGGFEGVGKAEWGHSEDVHTGLKMINSFNRKGLRYRIKYVPIQLATGICPSDHLSFYKQQNRWATGSMQLIFSNKTLFSKKLSVSQKITYFSNSVYYFYTMGLLLAPIQLLILLLSPRTYDWSFTLLFLPMLLVTYLLTPIILRQTVEPIAAAVVVISNAYTFVQAFWLLLIRKPLGWEATGAKSAVKKHHPQFRTMKLMSSGVFIAVYVATLAVLAMNYSLGFNPSSFIVVVFLASFIGHVIYLHHMLSTEINVKSIYKSSHAYGYAFLSLIVLFIGFFSYVFGKNYDVKYEYAGKIALVKTDVASEDTKVISEPIAQVVMTGNRDVTYVVLANDSQSKIATEIVNRTRKSFALDLATAGKLQDKLMHKMSYRDEIYPGDRYFYSDEQIRSLLRGSAKVRAEEVIFWSNYAINVGLR